MSMNLARTATAAVVGAGSGVAGEAIEPLKFGAVGSETVVSWGTIVEAVALLGGAGLQFMSPFTMPNIADGMVDGGIALLAARGARYVMTQTSTPTPAAMLAGGMYPARMVSAGNVAPAYRAAIGNINQSGPRVKLG